MMKTLVSRRDLDASFRALGMKPGMSVMVHSSLSGLGYLINGAYDIIDSIVEIIGPKGTILAPAHSGQLTDPADWTQPAVPAEWINQIRQEMRRYDPLKTPVRNRGLLPESLLRYPGVRRSDHPINSVAALGAKAGHFTERHPLHDSEGDGSPMHKLYRCAGHVLMLGVGLEACTAIHTAEFLANVPYLTNSNVKVLVADNKGKNHFVRLERYPESSALFPKLAPDLAACGALHMITHNDYQMSFMALAPAVNMALDRISRDSRYFSET